MPLHPPPTPRPTLPSCLQLSTRVILGMVEEIKAGGEPSALPEALVDSFRATLTQKVRGKFLAETTITITRAGTDSVQALRNGCVRVRL